ncbi:hypothetical protein HXX76_004258 [Chlamydomonas incerta]|uniref:Uncharacterized protein n=1 Tax=Chlamydomonas incerta TaxID=51695 RepID=A0A835TJU7_CHLIN|nr:hypothetical protein HXX76_004258 [Chlamydomonas incerta]|eukprot:KAG2440145.1 hypothetical protein HXX76_004258 [Chlamydomonas incerta]
MNSLILRRGVASLAFSRQASTNAAAPCLFRRPRAPRGITVKASKEPGPSGESDSVLAEAGRRAAAFWGELDNKQRVYTVVAGSALVLSLPQIIGVLLIPLERLLVGGLLAVEEAFALLILSSARLIALVGAVGLVLAGIYLFLFPKRSKD